MNDGYGKIILNRAREEKENEKNFCPFLRNEYTYFKEVEQHLTG